MFGMTGDDIYRNFHEGKGPGGLNEAAEIVHGIAETYGKRATQIRMLVARMESAWQGDAAGAAYRGAGPLAVEHEMSSTALSTAQDLTCRQAGSFSEAKGRVVPVPPKPELTNPLVVLSNPFAVDDFERQVDEYSAAAQNNVDVMNGYSGASKYNTVNLPTSYGKLSDDHAGIDVGTSHGGGGAGHGVIEGPSPGDDTGRDTDTNRDVSDSSDGGDTADRTPVDGPGHMPPPGPGTGSPGKDSPGTGPGSSTPGITSPGTFVPGPSPSPVGSLDTGAGRTPGPTIGTPSPGVGTVVPGPGGLGGPPGGAGPRGGGARPYGIAPGPRGGLPGAPGVGVEPHGPGARPGTGPAAAGARGTAPGGGFPMGAPGRSGEDTEHKRPEWLQGGDPDELFGTDVVTAPPTIGAEDD